MKKASKVDINNTTTIRYLKELGDIRPAKEAKEEKKPEHDAHVQRVSYNTLDKFQDDKPNIWLFINLILGAVIGIAFAYFLIVPTVKKNIASEYKDKVQEQSDFASTKDTTIKSLKDDIKDLNDQLKGKDGEIAKLKDSMIDEKVYDSLFDAITLYQEGKQTEAAEKLLDVDEKKMTSAKAKEYVADMKSKTFENASTELYEQAKVKYNYGNYKEAIPLFNQALKMNDKNVDAYYFLARAYDRSGDIENAKKYYQKVIDDFPDSYRKNEAEGKMEYLNR